MRFVVAGVRLACWSVMMWEEFEAALMSWIGFWKGYDSQQPA